VDDLSTSSKIGVASCNGLCDVDGVARGEGFSYFIWYERGVAPTTETVYSRMTLSHGVAKSSATSLHDRKPRSFIPAVTKSVSVMRED
jgi:hypothetical protein